MRKALPWLLLGALTVPAADLGVAEREYGRARYEEALRALGGVQAGDAAAQALTGKARYGLGEYGKAIEALERAVAAEPRNSHYWNWLGKAYGRRAGTGSFLTAPRNATRCRKAFEKAVELDPGNREALTDLFSYYLDAPGFLGGGVEKAEAVAKRIAGLDAAQGEWVLSELARKRGDSAARELHLKRAAALDPGSAGRALDLAEFLAGQGRWDESEPLFAKAGELAPSGARVLFSRARAYIEAKRDLTAARRLLEEYLASELTPDDPPRKEAQDLLKSARGG